MLLYLRLFFEFFKTGLFAVGGGLATLPFLYEMSAETGWFTTHDISNMIAVSESTPGPIGVNMSTYVGFQTAYSYFGPAGGLIGGIIVEIISGILKKFKESQVVKDIFYGLRPASSALVSASGMAIARVAFLIENTETILINWKALILGVVLFICIRKFKLHPIIYIAFAAAVGIIFKF